MLAPVVISFLYSLATDPAVPMLARATWDAIKARFNANISRSARVRQRLHDDASAARALPGERPMGSVRFRPPPARSPGGPRPQV